MTPSISWFLVSLVGCGSNKDDTGSMGDPALVLSPGALDFGSVPVDEPVEMSFTINNGGGGSFDLLSVQLASGDQGVWTISRDGNGTITADQNETVTVRFAPDNVVEETGQIQIRTGLADGNAYVDLIGSGGLGVGDADGDGFSAASGDCDDTNGEMYPGNAEVCDGLDNDCSGGVPADEVDEDGDGYRVCAGDCNDDNSSVRPGRNEICDDLDSDCDGTNDDHGDVDGDGYPVCDKDGVTTLDCNDNDALAYPGGEEICGDGADNDCSGAADDVDLDGDGHSVCGEGDCDDNNAKAYPVVVADGTKGAGSGTDDDPYGDIQTAMDNLDEICRTVYVREGFYDVPTLIWEGGDIAIVGTGTDPDDVTLRPAASKKAPEGRILEATGGGHIHLENMRLTQASKATGDGGAARFVSIDAMLDNMIFFYNTTVGRGGAVSMSGGTLYVQDTTFDENEATGEGGAVVVDDGAVWVEDSAFVDNSAGLDGGGISLVNTSADFADSSFVGNEADADGGALYATAKSSRDFVVERCLVGGNTAGASGGGFYLNSIDAPVGTIRNNIFVDNQALSKSGVGGAIALGGTVSALELVNNTAAANTNAAGGTYEIGATDTSGVTAWSNLAFANIAPNGFRSSGGADVSYCTSEDTSGGVEFAGDAAKGVDNTEEDPLFVGFTDNGDPTDDDFRLDSGSPAIDSGPISPTYNDPDKTRNDRGAFGGPGAPSK